MKFVGIDLHTNRFTCCYLSDNSKEKQDVLVVNEGFLCPIRKIRSILRAQKTLAEIKLHKGRSSA